MIKYYWIMHDHVRSEFNVWHIFVMKLRWPLEYCKVNRHLFRCKKSLRGSRKPRRGEYFSPLTSRCYTVVNTTRVLIKLCRGHYSSQTSLPEIKRKIKSSQIKASLQFAMLLLYIGVIPSSMTLTFNIAVTFELQPTSLTAYKEKLT